MMVPLRGMVPRNVKGVSFLPVQPDFGHPKAADEFAERHR